MVFAPHDAPAIGIWDPAAAEGSQFSSLPIPTFGGSIVPGQPAKFAGAIATSDGRRVVFVPAMSDVVGVYNAEDGTYAVFNAAAVCDTCGMANFDAAEPGHGKFSGATRVNRPAGTIVFAPFDANYIGLFPESLALGGGGTYTTVDISSHITMSGARRPLPSHPSPLPSLLPTPRVSTPSLALRPVGRRPPTLPLHRRRTGKYSGAGRIDMGGSWGEDVFFAPFNADAFGSLMIEPSGNLMFEPRNAPPGSPPGLLGSAEDSGRCVATHP